MNVSKANLFLKSSLANTPFDITDAFIKSVERIVRTSLEYKSVIADKRLNDNENSCELLNDYDFSDNKTKLQMHHITPLYEICKACAQQLFSEGNKNISTFEVANRVMEYHYENAFLYTFLSVSVHQLVHDGQYTIPSKDIKGNAKAIKEGYYEYLSPKDKDIVDNMVKDNV